MMYKKRSSVGRKAAALLVVPAMALALSVTNIPAVASVLSMASSANLFADSGDKISNNIPELKMTESEIAEINTEITAEIPEIAEITEPSESAEISNVGNEVSEPYNSGMVEEKVSDTNKKYTEEELKAFIAEHKAKYMEASNENASNTQSSEADQAKKDVFVAVEKMAEFPGGMEELMKWLTNNIRYPEEAMKNDTQGRVIVKFIIEEDGKISNPTIVRGVSPELDKEALRVVSEMPTWTPGEVNGKPVASYFNLPIAFKLTKPSTEKTE